MFSLISTCSYCEFSVAKLNAAAVVYSSLLSYIKEGVGKDQGVKLLPPPLLFKAGQLQKKNLSLPMYHVQ
jgi:hypothetical protein